MGYSLRNLYQGKKSLRMHIGKFKFASCDLLGEGANGII